jgi:TRAP-type C4-dicarboxylate transport system permease large subunit
MGGVSGSAIADAAMQSRRLGGDPVHFGVVFVVAATIGNFTPPAGRRCTPSVRS